MWWWKVHDDAAYSQWLVLIIECHLTRTCLSVHGDCRRIIDLDVQRALVDAERNGEKRAQVLRESGRGGEMDA